MTVIFSPFVSPVTQWILLAVILVIALFWLFTDGWKSTWRGLALAALYLAILNPSFVREEREPVKNIIAVVIDETGSQKLGDRAAMTDAARENITAQLAGFPNIEQRVIPVADAPDDGGTALFSALNTGLADIPAARIAGVILITDGIVHDIPGKKEALGFSAPIHVLVTGHADERDRQVRFLTTPRFGIVGKELELKATVEERGGTGSAKIILRLNGREITRKTVQTQTAVTIPVKLEHAGNNIVELEVAPLDNELTLRNNRAVLNIEGIRDKLRVLLVSGQPHPGERAWRNLLKSDPNVDLVHFTILRPAGKSDTTPINELSLIVFPIHDLFVNRLQDFDLVIFDRYANQGYIPPFYFDNIARYLAEGGAVLVAAGPEFASPSSLANTSLSALLPARPEGAVLENRFRPSLTAVGLKHPVTRDLTGIDGKADSWGEWFRIIGASAAPERTLMHGPSDMPLLVLDKAEKGRVAILLSDQLWLWARGYENGGPYLAFQRRLVHWLMREPALEEEALRARTIGQTIEIEQQSMKEQPEPVTIQNPDGSTQTIRLSPEKPGLFKTRIPVSQEGLYRFQSGDLVSFASAGPANPREFIDVFSSTEHMRSLIESTGGSIRRIVDERDEALRLPRVDTGLTSSRLYGVNWIGFGNSESYVTRGIRIFPVGTGPLALLILAGLALIAWAIEGRYRQR